jgi:predicted Ser/Thr protein kinase
LGAGAAACVMKGTWNKTEVAIKVLFQGSDLKELRKEVALLR